MSRSLFSYFIIFLKGMAMGAADVVPGVSGGTIAFISGIYEELLKTIDSLNLQIVKDWKREGFINMWKNYNLSFLLALFSGIFISILSLAKLISFLLKEYPLLIWAFFFGLVVASILYIGKQIEKWNITIILTLLIGAVIAYFITVLAPTQSPDALYFFFVSGFIAIIAMILPGISGSFILVILGSYAMVLGAVEDFINGILKLEWTTIKSTIIKVIVFILGCILGLKLFSKALKWMFANKRQLTLAILTGFMIGSLNKIWPWKKVLSTRLDRHGEEVVVQAKSILPQYFDGEPKLMFAILFAFLGFGLIIVLEKVANNTNSNAN